MYCISTIVLMFILSIVNSFYILLVGMFFNHSVIRHMLLLASKTYHTFSHLCYLFLDAMQLMHSVSRLYTLDNQSGRQLLTWLVQASSI